MLDSLIQQFAGGGHESMDQGELHGNVDQMLQAAPNPQSAGAVEQALGALGAGGFAQSIMEGAERASPQQRNALADTLLNAISQGGGSPNNVLSELGIGGQNMGAGELAQLAQHVMNNHPDALAGQLGGQLQNGDQGNGLLSLLGNPMVRQIGMQLAQKLM
jgi:hypothetical protein